MTSRHRDRSRVACVADEDEEGNLIESSTRYARSEAPSPTKEKANSSRSRKKERKGSSSPVTSGLTDSDSTVHPRRESRREHKSESKSSKPKEKSSSKRVSLTHRPAPRQSNSSPVVHPPPGHDSRYYGVEPYQQGAMVMPAATPRPRAYTSNQPRPNSYYGNPSRPRPPLSNQRFYTQGPGVPLPAYPAPHPPWGPAPPASFGPLGSSPVSQGPPDYFAPGGGPQYSHLSARFGPVRPQSAIGHRTPAAIEYKEHEEEEEEEERALARRPSLSRRHREETDRSLMPPPPRPHSTRPFMPHQRASIGSLPPRHGPAYDEDEDESEEESDEEESLFQAVPPLSKQNGYEYGHAPITKTRRPTVSYDQPSSYRTEVATTSGRRSSSFYDSITDKMRQAELYQDEINDGAPIPSQLTAENVRKVSKTSKHGGSSRSTRSSASHDESDYRQSATTRTTRSSNDEDVTIKVKGGASMEVNGANVQFRDGAEITFSGGRQGSTRAGGSDKASYISTDEQRSRKERPSGRMRAASQAGSYSRSLHPPPGPFDPIMPAYYGRPGGGYF